MESYRILMVSVLIAMLLIIPIASMFIGTSLHAYVPPPQPVVCVHFKPDMSMAVAKKLIDYAAELGAKYVRFDIWWYEIEPLPGQFNETALQRYKTIISYMHEKGLQPIVILGTGHPGWVSDLIHKYEECKSSQSSSISSSFIATKNVGTVAPALSKMIKDTMIKSRKHFDPSLELKQIKYVMNVCPIYYYASAKGYLTKDDLIRIASLCPKLPLKIEPIYIEMGKVPVKPLPLRLKILERMMSAYISVANDNDYCSYYMEIVLAHAYMYAKEVASYLGNEVIYYQLGNELNHFINEIPDEYKAAFIEALGNGVRDGAHGAWITIVNAFADLSGWSLYLTNWLEASGDVIDIIAIDHYPGTWTSTRFDYWEPLDTLIRIANQYYKLPAIMETGYPTCITQYWCPRENEQLDYINTAFNAIMQRAQNHYIVFLSWYMLWDESPNACDLWYCGWGVLREDFSKKPGWYALREWFVNKLGG